MSLIKEHIFLVEFNRNNSLGIIHEYIIAGTYDKAIEIANKRIESCGYLSIKSITDYAIPVIRESTKTITVEV